MQTIKKIFAYSQRLYALKIEVTPLEHGIKKTRVRLGNLAFAAFFCPFLLKYKDSALHNVGCRSPPFSLKLKNFKLNERFFMAYNKAREERKWRIWKEAEEKKLRELGVDKDTIERLHVYDWAVFNSERQYYEKKQEVGTYLEDIAEDRKQPEIRTVENFLNDIEDEKLHELLLNVDKLTLQIALWKIEGYDSVAISKKCGLSINAVNFRIWNLRKKLKNIL